MQYALPPVLLKSAVNSTLLTLLVATLLAIPVGAQAPTETFVDRVDVPLVNVEVWVSSSGGKPVAGLSENNFLVLEDGKQVDIAYFSEVTAASTFSRQVSREQENNAQTFGELSRPAPAATTHLVLFFDDAGTEAASRTQLVQDLRSFVSDGQVPAERILLLSFGETLQVESSFGSTKEQLQNALDAIAKGATRGTLEAGSKRLALRSLQQQWDEAQQLAGGRGDPCDLFLRRGRAAVEAWAKTRKQHLLRTLDALESTATLVSGIPGLKTVVYASDGMETSPGADLAGYMDSVCPARPDLLNLRDFLGELTDPIQSLSRHANANRVTFYTFQATGLRPSPVGSAESNSLDVRSFGRIQTEGRENAREGLVLLADETGGRAFLNRSDFGEQLEEIAEEMRSYYSIAFTPSHGGDGGDHRIEVRVLGGDMRVRYRGSYHDKTAAERLGEQLQSVLFLGDAENPLQVRLGAGDLSPLDKGRFNLPLFVIVPTNQVTFLPIDGSQSGRLLAQVGLRDSRNLSVIAPSRPYPVTAPADGETTFTFRIDLEVAPGPQILGVAVRDEHSLETSLVTTTINVPDPSVPESKKPSRRKKRGSGL